jgi:hypothetical protein
LSRARFMTRYVHSWPLRRVKACALCVVPDR